MADEKFSEFTAATGTNPIEAVGLQNGDNARFLVADIVDKMTFETLVTSGYELLQTPAAINTPKIMLFNSSGADIVSADGNATIHTDGRLTIGDAIAVHAVINFQVGKSGGAGATDFISYATVDFGAGEMFTGRPIHLKFSSDTFNTQKDLSRVFQAPPNSTVRFYWYNDNSDGGNNTGELQIYTCVAGIGPGGTNIPIVPSASLSVGTYKSGVR